MGEIIEKLKLKFEKNYCYLEYIYFQITACHYIKNDNLKTTLKILNIILCLKKVG